MGSYGIGPSRVLGTVVEIAHDDRGIVWPKSLAPFAVHLVSLSSKDEGLQSRIDDVSEELHDDLLAGGIEVLWDDRRDMSPGEKFADTDLIGIPLRLVISEKTLKEDSVEWKERTSSDHRLVKIEDIKGEVEEWVRG